MAAKSIIPPTGDHGLAWPSKFVLPQGKEGAISCGGWTKGNEGFVQQTFLGASVRNFDLSAGFGDTTSSLSVSVVEDEYNRSDNLGQGQGDDVYHNGGRDIFNPPIVGSPVFFKFGKNLADVEEAWRKTFDDTYGYNTLSLPLVFPLSTTTGPITAIPADHHFLKSKTGTGSSQVNEWEDKSIMYDTASPDMRRGYAHFVFGGILQSYTQNRGPGGNPTYNISVQDPREILSNATMVLNNYAGTTYNNKNLFNLYGFLEYDVSENLQAAIDGGSTSKSVLNKSVDTTTGAVSYGGTDLYNFPVSPFSPNNYPPTFPVTGQGYARRSDQGIPLYRVFDSMRTIFEMQGALPDEFKEKGFGGAIDFRGFKYVVDWTGIPVEKIPSMYFMDFDQIDMLSFAQELCDIISHDMLVSLLPVIDHPGCEWLHQKNQYHISRGEYSKVIAGIIRIDTIDKSKQPAYGAIKEYLDDLENRDIYVENRDVGYEVSNVTTDKFVVGAQEVEMYYFNTNKDRDGLQLRRHKHGKPNRYEELQGKQWSLKTALNQQVLPFYGFLGKNAVTIPRGWGSYQQIMLDSSSLNALGVGNYYIATEMELRHALISYPAWKKFLLLYSERYMAEVGVNQALIVSLAYQVPAGTTITGDNFQDALDAGRSFAVDVPRCVFNSDRDYMGSDGYPASPCSPPYGYPLYYKRAEKIGIPEAGFTEIGAGNTTMSTNFERAKNLETRYQTQVDEFDELIIGINQDIKNASGKNRKLVLEIQKTKFENAKTQAEDNRSSVTTLKARIKTTQQNNKQLFKEVDRLGKETVKNSLKVYNFVKDVASTYFGKKFLVKMPKACNVNYDKQISTFPDPTFNIKTGPFGFKPEPVNSGLDYSNSTDFNTELSPLRAAIKPGDVHEHYLDNEKLNLPPPPTYKYTYGALKNNFNPISEKWEFNYTPEPQGGFFNFAIYDKNLSFSESLSLPDTQLPASTQGLLAPRDLTNFVSENGRINCYVRYDNSQYLDLSELGKDSFTQQVSQGSLFIPDVMEEINNTSADDLQDFEQIADDLSSASPMKKAVAYVKCELDAQFYMAPKLEPIRVDVYARTPEVVVHPPKHKMVEIDVSGCKKMVPSVEYRKITLVPKQGGGRDGKRVLNEDFARRLDSDLNARIVKTELQDLDPESVYAVVTIPGKISATKEFRYADSIVQQVNAPQIKNAMSVDVVKGVDGFNKPSAFGKAVDVMKNACGNDDFSLMAITNAMASYKSQTKLSVMGLPEYQAGFSMPSPIHPNMIAIPLMSKERCYGPWMSQSAQNFTGSTQVRYSNIGGKLEFVKDEDLAPWNYAGYQLMNEAGQLKAQFSNSLLLFTERGGFVMPEAPTGISLAKALKSGGPLVTSLSVSIGDSIKTTVKMDLYTSRFGKLQKQKEDAIGKAARERQKIIDEKNALVRKGFGKAASSASISASYSKFAAPIKTINSQSEDLTGFEKGTTTPDRIIFSAKRSYDKTIAIDGGAEAENVTIENVGSIQDENLQKESLQTASDQLDLDYQKYNSAGGVLQDIFVPYSADAYHPNMPNVEYHNFQQDLGDY